MVVNVDPDKIRELNDSYIKMLDMDVSKNVLAASEALEETLTRVEEFLTVLSMVQVDSCEQVQEKMTVCKAQLADIDTRIDGLEAMVAHVRQTVDEMEDRVNMCEAETAAGEGNVFNFFIPLLKNFGQPIPNPSGQQHQPSFEPPEIFETSELFPKPQDGN